MRKSGILMPVFSLPGAYGIGCFSESARRFVDFLADAGQSYWQILPVGPTGYGDSPYQSFSTFAGNPYFISLERLMEKGLLERTELNTLDFGDDAEAVDYGAMYRSRLAALRTAYRRSAFRTEAAFQAFVGENRFWLEDYALFMAVKDSFGGRSMHEWPEDIRAHRPEAVAEYRERFRDEMMFYEFLQYEFFAEWQELRVYAASRKIQIIGDIPIYVSSDSADFWAHRELFQTDAEGQPTAVAGCPPDGFSATGQLWGNPLYRWPYHKETGFAWWITRIGRMRDLYDVIRIDHFRGFDEYFSVPAGAPDASGGHWEKGPGMDLFRAIGERYPGIRIIAEDLGYVTDTVRRLVRDSGFPNMKVLEFAFDSRDSSGKQDYLPYNYNRNCVVYTGTHDNETLAGWLGSILPEERRDLKDYLGTESDDPEVLVDLVIRMALSSCADTAVIPMQDYLGLDNRARINQPSTFGTNWRWRVREDALTPELAARIRKLTVVYGRS